MERLNLKKLPNHIAIIMDGNGRWAQNKRLSRIKGHQKGLEVVKEVVQTCGELGIKILTLFAFSKENWHRPPEEVNELMRLLQRYLLEEREELLGKNICLKAIGEIEDLPPAILKILLQTIEETSDKDGLILNLALSYGGRSEIVAGVRKVVEEVEKGKIRIEEITPDTFSQYLFTRDLPDPDLLIRTSGELRISNFLLWQIAYTELYFSKTLWPDFGKEELIQALLEYQTRERRFGLTTSQIHGSLSLTEKKAISSMD
jgi:undecaprenyl diphosphate synthase